MDDESDESSNLDKKRKVALFWLNTKNKRFESDNLGITCGLKSRLKGNDNLPKGKKLKNSLKNSKHAVDKGQYDVLKLEPGLELKRWTIDVWIKFPLSGNSADHVLIGPKDIRLGIHVS